MPWWKHSVVHLDVWLQRSSWRPIKNKHVMQIAEMWCKIFPSLLSLRWLWLALEKKYKIKCIQIMNLEACLPEICTCIWIRNRLKIKTLQIMYYFKKRVKVTTHYRSYSPWERSIHNKITYLVVHRYRLTTHKVYYQVTQHLIVAI